jgi:tRNA G18 (ribose-2'-O)-methylase SpoU
MDEQAAGGDGNRSVIVDPDDPRLADFRSLNDPAGRRAVEEREAIFVVEGRLAVDRLVETNHRIRALLIEDRKEPGARDLIEAVLARGAPVYVGSRQVVHATVGFALHRGVVAVAQRPSAVEPTDVLIAAAGRSEGDRRFPVVALLEGLNDHENVGALFRNAAAFGVAGVLGDPTCADPLYRRSVRVSMGHVLHVPFARLDPWPDGLERVRDAGFLVVALAPHSTHPETPAMTLAEVATLASSRHRAGELTGAALLLGAEGPGLSEAALAAADVTASIPMATGIDSLNVATAAAVAFHALREG